MWNGSGTIRPVTPIERTGNMLYHSPHDNGWTPFTPPSYHSYLKER